MIRVEEIAEHWFGLCRKPPIFRTAPALIVIQSEMLIRFNPMAADPHPDLTGSGMVSASLQRASGHS
jgi:hypothetical protein